MNSKCDRLCSKIGRNILTNVCILYNLVSVIAMLLVNMLVHQYFVEILFSAVKNKY